MTIKERHEKKVAELQELNKQRKQIISNLEQMSITISRTEGALIELHGMLQEESKVVGGESGKESVMGDGSQIDPQ